MKLTEQMTQFNQKFSQAILDRNLRISKMSEDGKQLASTLNALLSKDRPAQHEHVGYQFSVLSEPHVPAIRITIASNADVFFKNNSVSVDFLLNTDESSVIVDTILLTESAVSLKFQKSTNPLLSIQSSQELLAEAHRVILLLGSDNNAINSALIALWKILEARQSELENRLPTQQFVQEISAVSLVDALKQIRKTPDGQLDVGVLRIKEHIPLNDGDEPYRATVGIDIYSFKYSAEDRIVVGKRTARIPPSPTEGDTRPFDKRTVDVAFFDTAALKASVNALFKGYPGEHTLMFNVRNSFLDIKQSPFISELSTFKEWQDYHK